MSAQVHPPPRPICKSDERPSTSGFRPPEDRAFDVATINTRLARIAERAAPRGSERRRLS